MKSNFKKDLVWEKGNEKHLPGCSMTHCLNPLCYYYTVETILAWCFISIPHWSFAFLTFSGVYKCSVRFKWINKSFVKFPSILSSVNLTKMQKWNNFRKVISTDCWPNDFRDLRVFCRKYEQIHNYLEIWSHLLKITEQSLKSVIFCEAY